MTDIFDIKKKLDLYYDLITLADTMKSDASSYVRAYGKRIDEILRRSEPVEAREDKRMIDINKKYRTRHGGEVKLFTTECRNPDDPVVGEFLNREGIWRLACWGERRAAL